MIALSNFVLVPTFELDESRIERLPGGKDASVSCFVCGQKLKGKTEIVEKWHVESGMG